MSQISRDRRYVHAPIRWLRPGSAHSRSKHAHQHGASPLMHSGHAPRCLLHAPDLACDPSLTSHPASHASTSEVGSAKSP